MVVGGDVAGEGVKIRAQTPDMQVVDIVYAVDSGEGLANFDEGEAAGRALQQDVEGLAHDRDRRPG